MKHAYLFAVASLLLAACVDTTGLSAESSRGAHPESNANAAVVVAEYADLQCPACRAAHSSIVQPILQNYGSRIRYEFHHFPLTSIHRYAMEAAEAAECAADQGQFWPFVDTAFENQGDLSSASLEEWGGKLGLDMDLYNRCRDSHIKRDLIQEEYEQGRALGVNGTPTFFVNGQLVESSAAAIGAAIEEAAGSVIDNL